MAVACGRENDDGARGRAYARLLSQWADKLRADENVDAALLPQTPYLNPEEAEADCDASMIEQLEFELGIGEVEEDEVGVLRTLAGLYESKGRYRDALARILYATELAPNDAWNHVVLGRLFLRFWDPDAALDAYRRAVKLAPDLPAAYLGVADCLVRTGRPALAEAVLDRATAKTDEDHCIYLRLGAVRRLTGDGEGALKALRRAAELAPSAPEVSAALTGFMNSYRRYEGTCQLLPPCPSSPAPHDMPFPSSPLEESLLIALRDQVNPLIPEALIAAGARVNVADDSGSTPLHLAAWGGLDDFVEFLLDHGADPNARTDEGRTPLDLAEEHSHEMVGELLREHDAE